MPAAGRSLRDFRDELARQRGENPRAVAGVLLRAARTTMVHAAQQVIRVEQDLVAPLALYVRDEADAATVVLELGPIEAVSRRQAVSRFVTHIRRSSSRSSRWTCRSWGEHRHRQSRHVFRNCSHSST